MKVVIKNSNNNLFINNYKNFYLKSSITTIAKKNFMYNSLFINPYKNYVLLFKNYYYNNFIFNSLIINQINFYTLLNNNNNYYLVIKKANFEHVYNLTYKIILNITIKRRIKMFFANNFIVYINLIICLTKKFANKT
jgi:hypothetical protein